MSLSERIDDRPLDRERLREQPLGDRAGGAQRLGVADLAPVAALHPLGDQRAIGRAPRPSAGSGRSGARRRAAAAPWRRPGSSRRRAGSASPRASRRAAGRDSGCGARRRRRRSRLLHLRRLAGEEVADPRLGRADRPRRSPTSATRRTGLRPAPCRRCAAAPAGSRSWRAAHWRRSCAASSNALARPCAVVDQVLRQADALAFLGVVDAAGEHHVGHARGADQARDARRAAAADEDAALCLRAGRRRRCARRRGCAPRPRARARRRPPRRAARRSPAPGRTGSASNAACQVREWMIASATSRSCSSERSRPAQKCSPSPLSTTARTSAGRLTKAVVQLPPPARR